MGVLQVKHGEYLFVEVPEDAVEFEIYDKESLPLAIIVYRKDPKGLFTPGIPEPHWPIPLGNWQIISHAKDITKQQTKGVVVIDRLKYGAYKDYLNEKEVCFTAIESFESLLRSHEMKKESTIVLYK